MQPHRREQRALRIGADDVALAPDVPPSVGNAGSRGDSVEYLRRHARSSSPGRRVRFFRNDDQRSRRNLRGSGCAILRGVTLRRQRSVDAPTPREAIARIRPQYGYGPYSGIEGDRDTIVCLCIRPARMQDCDDGAKLRICPVTAENRATIRMAPLDIRNAAFVDRLAAEPAIVVQRRVTLAQIDERGNERDERVVGARPIDPC